LVPTISVVIPVRNGASNLRSCLDAIALCQKVVRECIVVDDNSSDGSRAVAEAAGAVVIQTQSTMGPAAARNLGAAHASGDLLVFIDSDVCVLTDTLQRIKARFEEDPTLDSLFGSYDAEPAAPGLVSQYKNLLQHYVHQHGHTEAETFWSGCGAIRSTVFREAGGFDERYTRPSIEDIDLGYRLKAAGHRIALDPQIQVKHLKRWGLRRLLYSDIFDRALPWTWLILRSRRLPDDLNLSVSQRITSVSVVATVALTISRFVAGTPLVLALPPLALAIFLNRRFFRFLAVKRGWLFLAGVMPLHLAYYVYSFIAFGAGMTFYRAAYRGTEEALPVSSKALVQPGRPDV